jgi:hypothetical protein
LSFLALYEIGRGREAARFDLGNLDQIRRVAESELALSFSMNAAEWTSAGNDVCAVFIIGARPLRGCGFAGLSRRTSISSAAVGLWRADV